MFEYNKLAETAKECGFTYCVPLNISGLEFLTEVREMCNKKACGNYGTSWSCPPACPSLDEIQAIAQSYNGGLLVQTVGDIEDDCDWDGMMAIGARHKANFGRLWDKLDESYPSVFAMGAGVCMLCEPCTYPNTPCRYPQRLSYSMEACGLLVNKVCTDNGLGYNYGKEKISFTSCFLLGIRD